MCFNTTNKIKQKTSRSGAPVDEIAMGMSVKYTPKTTPHNNDIYLFVRVRTPLEGSLFCKFYLCLHSFISFTFIVGDKLGIFSL
jgi:hypothetical protein